jgi:hypothetical protein
MRRGELNYSDEQQLLNSLTQLQIETLGMI